MNEKETLERASQLRCSICRRAFLIKALGLTATSIVPLPSPKRVERPDPSLLLAKLWERASRGEFLQADPLTTIPGFERFRTPRMWVGTAARFASNHETIQRDFQRIAQCVTEPRTLDLFFKEILNALAAKNPNLLLFVAQYEGWTSFTMRNLDLGRRPIQRLEFYRPLRASMPDVSARIRLGTIDLDTPLGRSHFAYGEDPKDETRLIDMRVEVEVSCLENYIHTIHEIWHVRMHPGIQEDSELLRSHLREPARQAIIDRESSCKPLWTLFQVNPATGEMSYVSLLFGKSTGELLSMRSCPETRFETVIETSPITRALIEAVVVA